MEKVAKFEKISYEQWHKDFGDNDQHSFDAVLDEIEMPTRSSSNSAGYDFHAPYAIDLYPHEEHKFATGLKCKIKDGWFLSIYPRSSLGFKYYTRLANTVGIIDSDYYNNKNNEGHIFVKIRNEGNTMLSINTGDKICQGIFVQYGITEDDDADGERTGGLGSSGK